MRCVSFSKFFFKIFKELGRNFDLGLRLRFYFRFRTVTLLFTSLKAVAAHSRGYQASSFTFRIYPLMSSILRFKD